MRISFYHRYRKGDVKKKNFGFRITVKWGSHYPKNKRNYISCEEGEERRIEH